MVEDAVRWVEPTWMSWAAWALVDLLGGVTDFSTVDAFGMFLETGARECEGFKGAGALREPIDSNRSSPVMSTFSTVLAAFETLRNLLDFRFSVSCFGFG